MENVFSLFFFNHIDGFILLKFENIFIYSESCFPVKSFCLSFDLFLSFDKNIDPGGKRATRDNFFLRGANLSRVSLMHQVRSKKDDLSHSES